MTLRVLDSALEFVLSKIMLKPNQSIAKTFRRGFALLFVTLIAVTMLIAPGAWLFAPQKEIDEALNRQEAVKLLNDTVGFTPSKPTLVFSWLNCCKPGLYFFGRGPGSKCAVYQLTGNDFDRVSTTKYPTSETRMMEGKCTGPNMNFVGYGEYKMKGCSELNLKLPSFQKVQWTAQGETCSADTGNILKINKENRLVMIERYWGD